MKKLILLLTLISGALLTFGQATTSKFGALAIDRNNGFYYGWSFDYPTLAEAEKKAIEECNIKGGNCSVVLSFSGSGCAAYRTIDKNVGTAFGWGIGKTKEDADKKATEECLKRSNGEPATNFVWSCNAANAGVLKEIYNASEEINPPVKIGNQVWMTQNLNVSTFKNGDIIPEAKTEEEWVNAGKAGKPAWCYYENDPKNGNKYGKLYNGFAATDPRGLAPAGWHVPGDGEWTTLINYLGGKDIAGKKMKSKTGWLENGNGTDESGFSGRPSGNRSYDGSFDNLGKSVTWWSSTESIAGIKISLWCRQLYKGDGEASRGNNDRIYGFPVRCVKD